jgi:hypothetical protein
VTAPQNINLDESQAAAVEKACASRFSIINGGAGTGKCLGADTPVLMYSGRTIAVQDIEVGDMLIGPDSMPRTVTSITKGREQMYRVTPKKGDSFTCNGSHILSVKHTRKLLKQYTDDKSKPFNVSVNDILEMPEYIRTHLLEWRTPVFFQTGERTAKRKQIKSVLHTGFSIEPIGEGAYYGFPLAESDGLFLLGDFTVTHNTTIIKSIAERIGDRVRLCAFAGKAAARIREATGRDASTIHRMLGYNGSGFTVKSLQGETVIMDEASMVPNWLMAAIVRRNPARLILVGDEAQLPPVGPGQPFHDLIKTVPGRVSTLSTCHRANEAIYQAAAAIRAGQTPPAHLASDHEEWEMCAASTPEEAHARIMGLVKAGTIDFARDIVLTPCNEGGAASVETLNADIGTMLFPKREFCPLCESCSSRPECTQDCIPCAIRKECGHCKKPGAYTGSFVPGDRAMCLKNLPDLDIWNGTTGAIEAMDIQGRNGRAIYRTDSPVRTPEGVETDQVSVPINVLNTQFARAYTLTVHKSQGSQYRRVYILCLARDAYTMLDRSLIYTAVTRAREYCCIIGDFRAFKDAIRKTSHRNTAMQELA